ncbi:type III polyketide synthase [Aggregatilinea lenta]|uniref:type III polyketide synthase n=1 Tax=Aggregatilinea lenta TaxID=913108 RepID=UPI000E5B4815|nr:type III polyketide synthase [Aggregatilinea lenta]
MGVPEIVSIATGVPDARYSQQELFDQLQALGLTTDPRAEAVFQNAGVAARHAAVAGAYYAEERTTETRNNCYLSEALPLGENVLCDALNRAGLRPQDVDDFVVVSCTGIDTPGLDLRLAGRLGMRPDLRRTSVLGMGCYAAFPGLWRGREAVQGSGGVALVLMLELCSLHLQMDDSLENMVAAALFADGAAAAVIGANGSTHGPRLIDQATYCDYTTFDHMAFHLTDHGFQMRLSAYVPDLLAASVEDFAATLLDRHGLRAADVPFWAIHPGSGKILDHVQARLALTDAQMAHSRAVLRDYGNMSSATILFVLDALQRAEQPQSGDYGVLMAFGPGLTMESLLVQW